MPEGRLSRLLKAKLLRRSSTSAVPKAGNGADPRVHPNSTSGTSGAPRLFDSTSEKSPYSLVSSAVQSTDEIGLGPDRHKGNGSKLTAEPAPSSAPQSEQLHLCHTPEERPSTPPLEPTTSPLHTPTSDNPPSPFESPLVTPQHSDDTSFNSAQFKVRGTSPGERQLTPTLDTVVERSPENPRPAPAFFPQPSSKRPSLAVRRQSLLPPSHQHLIRGLLDQSPFTPTGSSRPPAAAEMVHRRVWVKRPGASATLVPYLEDAVVDELRDQVIMKYANSLGRTFDSPDIVIRIPAREGLNRQSTPERLLSPEELLSSVLDTYFPGGQAIEEALVIDAPTRRTPKPSPRPSFHHHHSEPGEPGDYFPLMPAHPKVPTPPTHSSSSGGTNAPSMSIVTTGVPPALPSPGNRAMRHARRPQFTRHTTSSPTLLGQAPNTTGTQISNLIWNRIPLTLRRTLPLPPFSSSCSYPEYTNTTCAGARFPPDQDPHTTTSDHLPANSAKTEGSCITRCTFWRID